MFKPEREPKINREEKPKKKEQGLKEETKREINQHLKYLWEKIENEAAYQSGMAASLDEIKKIQKKQESNEALIQKAKKQLGAGEPGKEILHIILNFPTAVEEEAENNLYQFTRLLERQTSGKLKPPSKESIESIEKQKLSFENQRKLEHDKRNNWAKQLKEDWKKKKEIF